MPDAPGKPYEVGPNQHQNRPGRPRPVPAPEVMGQLAGRAVKLSVAYGYDTETVEARAALLDALQALAPHAEAFVLVGAQAVYEHTKDLQDVPATFTKDGDLAVDPSLVTREPSIHQLMLDAGFFPARPERPGIYSRTEAQPGQEPLPPTVDLIVPKAVSGAGRRGARIDGQDKQAVGKSEGLEMALLDYEWAELGPVAPGDKRPPVRVKIAGAGALLCAKAWTLAERFEASDTGRAYRLRPKDAADVWRLMAVSDPEQVRTAFERCQDHTVLGASVATGKRYLLELFANRGRGAQLASEALSNDLDEGQVYDVIDQWVERFQH
jgi:hypothetical protein